MALTTHPDKLPSLAEGLSPATSFVEVRAAAEVLLDPIRRADFDAMRMNHLVRGVGRVSSVLESDDGVTIETDADGVGWVVAECRCGGEYRVLLRSSMTTSGNVTYHAECDCCSLVVEMKMMN
jgi:DnaJ-class molecular chaperone